MSEEKKYNWLVSYQFKNYLGSGFGHRDIVSKTKYLRPKDIPDIQEGIVKILKDRGIDNAEIVILNLMRLGDE